MVIKLDNQQINLLQLEFEFQLASNNVFQSDFNKRSALMSNNNKSALWTVAQRPEQT